jgi:hypothetical protein
MPSDLELGRHGGGRVRPFRKGRVESKRNVVKACSGMVPTDGTNQGRMGCLLFVSCVIQVCAQVKTSRVRTGFICTSLLFCATSHAEERERS